MKFRLLGSLGLMMLLCLSTAMVQAQDEQQGRGRGRGGFGGGFGGGRGGFQLGGALDLMGLLAMEQVRTEVGMEEEIWNAIPDDAKRPDFGGFRDASEEERTKLVAEANEKAQSALDEVLQPEKQKRLLGLLAQRDGYRATSNELIAKEIGLDEEGRKKVQEAVTKSGEEMREAFGRGRGQGGDAGNFNPEDFRARFEEARKKQDETIAAALTEDQKQKFEALKGEKFEFPEFGGFGRGGGGRGQGGPGGPGGRGGPEGRPGGGNRPSGDGNNN